MSPKLPEDFLRIPIAHRALHDIAAGRPENSLEAVKAAVDAGYGIEIDLQPSADGHPMVFHDYHLGRLTDQTGPVHLHDADTLGGMALSGSDLGDTISTLRKVLEIVAGKVPLLIEIKDQDGALGPDTGALERATARVLEEYDGPVAVMSFNPHAVAAFAEAAPDIPVGLVTDTFTTEEWGLVPPGRLTELIGIPDFDRVGASFISHRAEALGAANVARLKARGVPILTWTIRSPEEEARAREVADNITFEGYLPPIPR